MVILEKHLERPRGGESWAGSAPEAAAPRAPCPKTGKGASARPRGWRKACDVSLSSRRTDRDRAIVEPSLAAPRPRLFRAGDVHSIP